jgi:hypothetical protein
MFHPRKIIWNVDATQNNVLSTIRATTTKPCHSSSHFPQCSSQFQRKKFITKYSNNFSKVQARKGNKKQKNQKGCAHTNSKSKLENQ